MKKIIGACDLETQPFKYGRFPHAFLMVYYDHEIGHHYIWNDNPDAFHDECVAFFDWLSDMPVPRVIFWHNGGKFDARYFLDIVGGNMRMIGQRILRAKYKNLTFQDSFPMLQKNLRDITRELLGADQAKLEIDFEKLELVNRHRHRDEILRYARRDVECLVRAIDVWQSVNGRNALTAASAAFSKLNEMMTGGAVDGSGARVHFIDRLTQTYDDMLRPFFRGGRVQPFQVGAFEDQQHYDANSMYPFAMAAYLHPVGSKYTMDRSRLSLQWCDFAIVDIRRNTAIPFNDAKGKLTFEGNASRVHVTGHEIRAAMTLGLVEIARVHQTFTCDRHSSFAPFVLPLYADRLRYKAAGDEANTNLVKLWMNSAYGKTGIDPHKYKDVFSYVGGLHEFPNGADVPGLTTPNRDAEYFRENKSAWQMHSQGPYNTIYTRPNQRTSTGHINVGTAASITGAARAHLMRAIASAHEPRYCDTDSVICSSLGRITPPVHWQPNPDYPTHGAASFDPKRVHAPGRAPAPAVTEGDDLIVPVGSVILDGRKLGGWKLEKGYDVIYVRARKLYAGLVSGKQDGDLGRQVVRAKGLRVTFEQVRDNVLHGTPIVCRFDAPVISLVGKDSYISRTVFGRENLARPKKRLAA